MMFARILTSHSSLPLSFAFNCKILYTTASSSLGSAMSARPLSGASFDGHRGGSFGGKDQSKSAFNASECDPQTFQLHQPTYKVTEDRERQKEELSGNGRFAPSSSIHPGRIPSESFDAVAKASGLQRQEDFPELIGSKTSRSSNSGSMDSTVPRILQREHSLGSSSIDSDAPQIIQPEDAVCFPGRSQISSDSSRRKRQTSINPGISQKIHTLAGKEDDWEPQSRRGQRTSGEWDSKKGFRESLKSGNSPIASNKGNHGDKDRIYYLGRLMTSILRHRAAELNLKIRNDGYVAVNDFLKLQLKTQAGLPLSIYTVDDVCKAVKQDNKQRFGLLTENGVLLVRANQGHSMKVVETEKLLKLITSADEISVCVHGTFMKNIDSILKNGLSKMTRNHVHFASGLPHEDGVISGMRSHCEILIYLDVEKALQDGMKLYLSDNGVILTEGFDGVVPRKYFSQISKWKKGKIIPMETDLS